MGARELQFLSVSDPQWQAVGECCASTIEAAAVPRSLSPSISTGGGSTWSAGLLEMNTFSIHMSVKVLIPPLVLEAVFTGCGI